MTKREAMRRVCAGAVAILDNDSENLWLRQEDGCGGEELSAADQKRMKDAFDALCDELRRRAGDRCLFQKIPV